MTPHSPAWFPSFAVSVLHEKHSHKLQHNCANSFSHCCGELICADRFGFSVEVLLELALLLACEQDPCEPEVVR